MERNDGGTGSKTSNIIFCEFLCLLRGNYLMTYLSWEFSRLRGRIIDGMRSNLNAHPYSMFSFPRSVLGPLEWACPEYLGLSSIVCGLALGVFTLPCTNGVSFLHRIASVAPPIKPHITLSQRAPYIGHPEGWLV